MYVAPLPLPSTHLRVPGNEPLHLLEEQNANFLLVVAARLEVLLRHPELVVIHHHVDALHAALWCSASRWQIFRESVCRPHPHPHHADN